MKLLVANWKMNPMTLGDALGLFNFYLSEMQKYQNIRLVVCPPFVYLEEIANSLQTWKFTNLQNVSLGAQDLFWERFGPYTGEVSVDMLKNFGVNHVLVGHSDRRYKIGESDEIINKKIEAALEAEVSPVLLVGEKNQGDDKKKIITDQLSADLAGLNKEQISKILIAYEPVWAISAQPNAKADTPENVLEAIGNIENFLITNHNLKTTKYLYGGSVNKDNIGKFLQLPELCGIVIGGASLHKEEFGEILRISAKITL